MFLQQLDPRTFSDRARLVNLPRWNADQLAIGNARRIRRRLDTLRAGGITGGWSELLWVNTADFSAVANTASEASLLAGVNDQPTLQGNYFLNKPGYGRAISLHARGVLSTTSTPTIVFQVRFGTTVGSSFLSGTSMGVSAAITTASGITNKWWELRLDLVCRTPGQGSGNTTLSGSGYVNSPGGFASPFTYPLEPTTPDTATWTATMDNTLQQYINLSVTWGSASSSNTITLKHLALYGLN